MKLGDIWVKLGLKKDEFSRGMKEAGEEASGSGGLLGKIKSLKAGALAAFAAIAAGAVAMADKFAHTSQRLGDQWDQVTAGLKASWRSFLTAVNSTDFSNLGKRLSDAFRNAREVAASSDLEFEVMNSIELRKAQMDQELEALRITMQNQKLSQDERVAAAEEYLRKIKPLYDEEEKYRNDHFRKVRDAYLKEAKVEKNITTQRLAEYLFTDVANKPDLMNALDKYAGNGFNPSAMTDKEWGLITGTGLGSKGHYEELAKLARQYNSTTDEEAKALVDAMKAYYFSKGAFDKETRRVQAIANQSVAVGITGDDSGSALDRALESAFARIENVTDDQMEKLEKELESMNGSIEFDPIEITPPDMSEWDEFYKTYQDNLKRTQELLADFRDAAIGGFSDAVQELADQFAGLEEINPGRVVAALLTPLADMAVKEGEILMAEGIGVEACKEALESLNGYAAIAAGAALIAIGAAAKAGLSSLASTAGKGTSTSTYTGSSGSTAGQNIQTEMTVYVKGTIKGSDIVLSGQKTVKNWGR